MRGIAGFFLAWLPIVAPIGHPAVGQSLKLKGGPVRLQVTTAPAGQNPPPATDASTTLRYSERRDGAFKVTVMTSAPGQRYELRVRAMDVPPETSAGEVTLTDGMVPATLLRNVDLCDGPGGGPPGGDPPGGGGPPCKAQATLRYRTFVEATDEPGTDSHTVTYTITAQ